MYIIHTSLHAFIHVDDYTLPQPSLSLLTPSLLLVLTLLGRATVWCVLLLWLGQLISQLSPGWIQ